MTETAVREYFDVQRSRYHKGSKRQRTQIIDEVVQVTGWHRKSVIRRFNMPANSHKKRPGRPERYGSQVGTAVYQLWVASGQLCSILLHPFLPQLISSLRRHGQLVLDPTIEDLVLSLSRSTLERLLAPRRGPRRIHGQSTTRPGTLLRAQIPLRTWSEWDDATPGFVEIDLLSHAGESAEGFFLYTLTMVDVATGWTELEPVWGKGEARVGGAIHRARMRLPFPLKGVHSDNGSEFINHNFVKYCREHNLRFTRSRPYRKNDNALVEQKNGAVVRKLVGYDRYTSRQALTQLAKIYSLACPRGNYFQPQQHLISKSREGAKVHRRYDPPQTPAQRTLHAGALGEIASQHLLEAIAALSPLQLTQDLDRALEHLWTLAKPAPYGASSAQPVTLHVS